MELKNVLPCGIIRNLPCDSCSPGGPGEFGGQTRNLPILVVDVSPSAIVSLQNIYKTSSIFNEIKIIAYTHFSTPQRNIIKEKLINKMKSMHISRCIRSQK